MLVHERHARPSSLEDFGSGFSRAATAQLRVDAVLGSKIAGSEFPMPEISSVSDYWFRSRQFFLGDSAGNLVRLPFELFDKPTKEFKKYKLPHIERLLINGNYTLYVTSRHNLGLHRVRETITLPYPDYNPVIRKLTAMSYITNVGTRSAPIWKRMDTPIIKYNGEPVNRMDLRLASRGYVYYRAVKFDATTGDLKCPMVSTYTGSLIYDTKGVAGILTHLNINKDSSFSIGFIDYPDQMLKLPIPDGSHDVEYILKQSSNVIMLAHDLVRLEKLVWSMRKAPVDFGEMNDMDRVDFLFHGRFREICKFLLNTYPKYTLTRRLAGRLVYQICHVIGLGYGSHDTIKTPSVITDYIRGLLYPECT